MNNPEVRAALASALASVHFSPIEKEIMFLLADGESHPVKVVAECLGDELASKNALQSHIKNIRRKIEGFGHEVVCSFENRRLCYRYVLSLRLLSSIRN